MSRGFTSGRSLPADWISHGPILQVCWTLFAPLALSMMASATVGITDMYLAGILGSNAQAAVGIGDQLLFFVLVLGTGLSIASSALIAQAAGALDHLACKRYADASLLLGTLAGIMAAAAGMIFAEALSQFFGCDEKLRQLSVPYTMYNAPANLPFVLSLVCSGIFRALGRADLSLNLWLITATIANIVSFAVFFTPYPGLHYSLNALAIGWCAGASLGCAYGLYSCYRLFSKDTSSIKLFEILPGLLRLLPESKHLLCVGVPAMFAELALVLSHFCFYKLLALCAHSANMQAAWTIKLKLEEVLAIIPLMALGMSTAVIIAQSLGAGLYDRAKRASCLIGAVAVIASIFVGIALALSARPCASFFSSEPITQSAAISLIAPSCLILPLLSLSTICCSAMEGAGQTRIPMILNLLLQLAAKLSLAYFLAISPEFDGMRRTIGSHLSMLLGYPSIEMSQLAGLLLAVLLAQSLMSLCSFISCFAYFRKPKTHASHDHNAKGRHPSSRKTCASNVIQVACSEA